MSWGTRCRVTWRDAWDREREVTVGCDLDVTSFVEGLAFGDARGIVVNHLVDEPEPWTFGDLDDGDWFECDRGRVWQWVPSYYVDEEGGSLKVNAHCAAGSRGWFELDAVVEPFEWDWSE